MTIHQNPRDKQPPHTGKVENDTNKLGEQDPTQINQGKRTPESRSNRESHVGGSNQSQSRRGPAGSNNRQRWLPGLGAGMRGPCGRGAFTFPMPNSLLWWGAMTG